MLVIMLNGASSQASIADFSSSHRLKNRLASMLGHFEARQEILRPRI